jgi:hypothetical protein
MAAMHFSASASVVFQPLTLMRMAVLPCHTVSPAHIVPSAWIAAITRRVTPVRSLHGVTSGGLDVGVVEHVARTLATLCRTHHDDL